MKKTIKLCFQEGKTFFNPFTNIEEETTKDHWTTIKVEEEHYNNDKYVQHLGKDHLRQKIAMEELGNIKSWKYLTIDTCDITIVR